MKRAMLLRLSLFLALTVTICPAAFRTTANTYAAQEADADDDGLDDAMETALGTDPDNPDTDGDGWDDLTEVFKDTDPFDPQDFPHDTNPLVGTTTASSSPLKLKVIELLATRRRTNIPVIPPGTTDTDAYRFSLRYYHVGRGTPNLAVQIQRSDLKAGSYLLFWRHHVRWNPLQVEQRYTVSIRTGDGRTIGEWQTPSPVDVEEGLAGLHFMLKPSDEGQMLTLSLIPDEEGKLEYSVSDFVTLPAGIEADVDRDGAIGNNERPIEDQPLRHWVNDDDDRGECQEGADLPGRPVGQTDHAQPGIDGLRDLVDFLPINLNLARITSLLRPSDGFRYYVCHPDRAVQVALSGLTPTKVGVIHREPDLKAFGPAGDAAIDKAEILKPDEQGRIEIPAAFVERITDLRHGVILLEGTKASQQPLRIEIRQGDKTVATFEQRMAIVPVESMYRHVNLAGLTYDYHGQRATVRKLARPRQIGDPEGLPDKETIPRWVVMIHGYSVAGDMARSWHAETFKRLYVLGSKARFVGITWNGDTGLDYHRAVYHAFQAGDELPRALGFLDESRTLLIGHSLGNIVASQAVQAGFKPARYFLLNAALPIEAIAGNVSDPQQAREMTEQFWRPYQRRLFASDWSKLHSLGDQRRSYTWNNAFAKVRSLELAMNCFSAGEDVTNCPADMTSASVLATLWAGRAIDYGAWKTQELLKGVSGTRSLGAVAMQQGQGGWGFNPSWRGRYVPHGPTKSAGGHYERLSPEEAARLSRQQLLPEPFFSPLKERWLHSPRPARLSPLMDVPHVRYELLATAIPALSYAAGGQEIPATESTKRIFNFDLEKSGRSPGRWPTEGHTAKNKPGRWLHSDFKNVALPFVHPLFTKMIVEGSLR
jgi:hypothetical protein